MRFSRWLLQTGTPFVFGNRRVRFCNVGTNLKSIARPRFFSSDQSGAFKDRIVLDVTAGKGGTGCISFARGPNLEYAPPDGGNGGDGGSVWLRVDASCKSLRQSTTVIHAASGGRGRPAKCRGRSGEDLIISVPPGTVVYELRPTALSNADSKTLTSHKNETNNPIISVTNSDDSDPEAAVNAEENQGGEDSEKIESSRSKMIPLHKLSEEEWNALFDNLRFSMSHLKMQKSGQALPGTETAEGNILVAELNSPEESIQVAAGGRGGRGNAAYKSSTNRSPMRADDGAPGESRRLELVLKTIADVGLVGFPNAGKSTFLRAVSHAKPKVAAYPFTTLRPHIGVVNADDEKSEIGRTLTVADIPGLIEGAHEDRGLGHDFLKHIERTTFLVYVVDVAGVGSVDACKALNVLKEELELYLPGLSSRAGCIVANKMDSGELARKNLVRLIDNVGDEFAVFPVSAKYGLGVDAVVKYLSEKIRY